MELDDGALPLTRAQLDIWLDQETGHSGTEWQVGLLVRIDGAVDLDALEWAISRVMREAEPLRVACFEEDGQVYQRAIDYPEIELEFHDLSGLRRSRAGRPRKWRCRSSARQCRSTGPLFRYALFQTGPERILCVRVLPPHRHGCGRHRTGRQSHCVGLLRNRLR